LTFWLKKAIKELRFTGSYRKEFLMGKEGLHIAREPKALNGIQAMLLDPEVGEGAEMALYEAYLHHFRSLVGCQTYSHLPVWRDGDFVDVMERGRYSCAYFVLSVLHHFGLVEHWNTWVREAEPLLIASGWKEVAPTSLCTGDVIIYETFNGNEHVGFYDGNGQVISTALSKQQLRWSQKKRDAALRMPRRHDYLYRYRPDGPRNIKSVWTHPALQVPHLDK
jgi:hypothetical protein